MFSSWIRWLLVELKSNSSIWTSLYPIQDAAAVDVGFKVSPLSPHLPSASHFAMVSFSVVFECFSTHFAFMCEWICNTNVQTQLLFVHFKKWNPLYSIFIFILFCVFLLLPFCLKYMAKYIWQSTFMFILLMECWQFQRKEENIHPPAQERTEKVLNEYRSARSYDRNVYPNNTTTVQ